MCVLSIVSCTAESNSIYGAFKTYRLNGNNIYMFPSKQNERLLIYIEGSGTTSVLGEIKNKKWVSYNLGYFLTKYMKDSFTIIIPEKLGMNIGQNIQDDPGFMRSYTVNNLVNCYVSAIDGYLDKYWKYKNVYIVAGSEGGLLFPKIYSELKNRNKISKAIVIGAGGLDQYVCFKILGESPIEMPSDYRRECKRIDDVVVDIKNDPESIDKKYFGWPYTRWSSFFNYKPFNYYKEIDIPILFYQGVKDWNSPIESVEYIEKNMNNPKFEYRYKNDMGHVPNFNDENSITNYFNELSTWLINGF
jgi:pimeloyl-ACP methyl ester carboxylesterase